jgi:hypothetical protein
METTRHIRTDLHRNKFTCCMQLANGRNYLSEWKLENLAVFVKKATLRHTHHPRAGDTAGCKRTDRSKNARTYRGAGVS